MISEREKVMIQREAAVAAMSLTVGYMSKEAIRSRAAAMFPLPKVSRRRILRRVDGLEYRVRGDGETLEYRRCGTWLRSDWTRADAEKLVELFKDSNELVDAGE
jgi:hypothetical protein